MTDMVKQQAKAKRVLRRKNGLPVTGAYVQKKTKHIIGSIARYVLIICLSYLILAPIFKNITVAFTDPRDLGLSTSIWIPFRTSIENWHVSALMMDYWNALPYTLVNTLVLALLQTFCAVLAGYSFARLKFRFQGILFGLVIFTIIVPSRVFMLPQYLFFREFDILGIIRLLTGKPLNLLNQPISLYIMSLTGMGIKSGLYIYILRQTFRGLPKELEEAAYIDGAGFIRTFVKIVLPSAGAGILTVGVLSYVWNWNDYYYLNLFDSLNRKNLMLAFIKATASTDEALNAISSRVPADYLFLTKNPLYESAIARTAALEVLLPLILLYLLVQRKFVQSAERSGLVG